jgi:molecular chaperone DnaK (HSP70)
MVIKVFEGQRVFTKNNRFIEELMIRDITPGPKGAAAIEVLFEQHVSGEESRNTARNSS